jgi:hypothetical protein
MSMGKRVHERQPEMWVATTNFPTAASHPFYTRLNQRLAEHYFDDFVEGRLPQSGERLEIRPSEPNRLDMVRDSRSNTCLPCELAHPSRRGLVIVPRSTVSAEWQAASIVPDVVNRADVRVVEC